MKFTRRCLCMFIFNLKVNSKTIIWLRHLFGWFWANFIICNQNLFLLAENWSLVKSDAKNGSFDSFPFQKCILSTLHYRPIVMIVNSMGRSWNISIECMQQGKIKSLRWVLSPPMAKCDLSRNLHSKKT